MTELDEDAPPALSKLADQVAALKSKDSGNVTSATATVTPKYTTSSKPAPLKSGFFNKQSAKPVSITSQKSKDQQSSATPHIKSRQGPAVPDIFMIPPDEQEKQYAAMRKKLTEELMPTEDTVKQIAENKSLLAGFDDPEVMKAVQDVAQNPANIQKYKNNKKVQAFYQQMGTVMAQRCDELGSSKASSRQPNNSKLASPTSAPMPVVMPAQGQQQQTCKIEEVT
ncbi:TPA: Hsc70-interacting protein [Trebouxia sp. C0006]